MTQVAIKRRLDLQESPTVWKFMQSEAFVRIIIGPVGSGKSTGCCGEIMRQALLQEPGPDGLRRYKAGIVRNTYGELLSTTVQTWKSMFPPEMCGPIRLSVPITQHIKKPAKHSPGHPAFAPGLDLLIEFMALDRPKDVKKLLSWEGSLIWFNECREIERAVFDAATSRVGRYPSMAQGGVECTRPCVIADTNPPDDQHWLYKLEMEGPEGWEYFHQPGAVVECKEANFEYNSDDVIFAAGTSYVINPDAENIKYLPKGYYQRMLPGKNKDWIHVYVEAKYGFVKDGKPVIPEYNEELMAKHDLPVLENVPLIAGADIGGGTLQPAAVIAQRHPRGIWLIHAEVVCQEMGLDRFSDQINQTVAEIFPGRKIDKGFGDPAGATRDEIFETSGFQHLRSKGIPMYPAPTQNPKSRIEAIRTPMGRLIDGQPGFQIHKRCTMLRYGLGGRWTYKRLQVSGSERYAEHPDKNEYSHPCDGLGYLLSGGGEDRALKGRAQQSNQQPIVAAVDFNVF